MKLAGLCLAAQCSSSTTWCTTLTEHEWAGPLSRQLFAFLFRGASFDCELSVCKCGGVHEKKVL